MRKGQISGISKVLYLLFLLQLSACNDQASRKIASIDGESFFPLKKTEGSACIETLLALTDPNFRVRSSGKIAEILGPEKMKKAKKIKYRQKDQIERMEQTISGYQDIQKRLLDELYTFHHTTKYSNRFKGPLGEYGVHLDAATNETVISTFGEPKYIKNLTVNFYDSAIPTNPIKSAEMIYDDDAQKWITRIDGDLEGKWYQFVAEGQEGATNQFNVPIPSKFTFADDFVAWKPSSSYGTQQLYYPPDPSFRPKTPTLKVESPTTQEINLTDWLTPSDVPEKYWWTPQALIKSKTFNDEIEGANIVEFMPLHTSTLVETFSSNPSDNFLGDVLYLHHWGYNRTGNSYQVGPEFIVEIQDYILKKGKLTNHDTVWNHTSNGLSALSFRTDPYYRNWDYTGCGNTLDMMNPIMQNLAFLQVEHDITMGFRQWRFDLAGANDRRFIEIMDDYITSAIRKRDEVLTGAPGMTGEPYVASGEFGRSAKQMAEQQTWNRHYNRPNTENAAWWDDEGRLTIRRFVNGEVNAEELSKRLSGHIFSEFQQSNQRLLFVESHDDTTLLEAVGGDYRKWAQAIATLFSGHGNIMIGPAQWAPRMGRIDDTPIDTIIRDRMQEQAFKYMKDFLNLRQKHFGTITFGQEFIDPNAGTVKYLAPLDGQVYAIRYKKEIVGHGELIVIDNSNNYDAFIDLPAGEWKTLVDSKKIDSPNAVVSDLSGSLEELAVGNYKVEPHSAVWLYKAD